MPRIGDNSRAGRATSPDRGRGGPSALLCIVDDPRAESSVRARLGAKAGIRITMVVELRSNDRRHHGQRRRIAAHTAQAHEDRRTTRGQAGRRVDERRAPTVQAAAPALLADFAAAGAVRVVERIDRGAYWEADFRATRLAIRFQSGDRTAFDEIYTQYYSHVRQYLLPKIRDVDEAEDITQQVFMNALKALPRYEPRGASFGRWLFTIARNTVIDVLRVRRHSQPVDPHVVHEMLDQAPGSESVANDPMGDYDLRPLLDALPDDQRAILVMRYELGLNPPEISELLGRSPAAVSGIRHRALVALEHALATAGHPATVDGPVRRPRNPAPLPALA